MSPHRPGSHRYLAFLRAVNVGGRTVKMDRLRLLFEGLGFTSVETFIASGNVAFVAEPSDAGALERRIEEHLHAGLGFAVDTFVRTPAELAEVAALRPPSRFGPDAAGVAVAFLHAPPSAEVEERLLALRSEVDDFHLRGREVYWVHRVRQSESRFSAAALEKAIGGPATMRNVTTVRKLATKYPVAAATLA